MKQKTNMFIQVATFSVYRMFNFAGIRMAFPFLTILSRSMGTSVEQISFAISIASVITVLSPFLAQIGERLGKRTGMISGMLTFVVAGLIAFFSNNFFGFLFGTLLLQLSINTFSPAMQAYLSDHIPFEKRGMALSATELGWPLSYLLLIPLIALRIEQWGWNVMFLIIALVGLLFTGIILLQVEKDPVVIPSKERYKLPFKEIFKSKNAVFGLIMGFCVISGNIIVQLVFGVWLEEDFQASVTQLGLVSSFIGAAECAGILLSIFIIDRIGKRRGLLIGIAACVLLPFLGLFANLTFQVTTIWLVVFFFFSEFAIVSELTIVSELYPRARNTYMALYAMMNAIGFGAGSILAPLAYRYHIQGNMMSSMVLYAIAGLFLLMIKLPKTSSSSTLETAAA
ncbi:MAG: MFS transporter [Anaerolineaceae bacterium]|nr:MFS transporter [Anaerolineaceae bacterium]